MAQKPKERFTVGRQPCQSFLRGDADVMALGDGNRLNLHQCPRCCGNRAWCDNCNSDHHDGGWETCKPGAYDYDEDDASGPGDAIQAIRDDLAAIMKS